MCVNRDSQNRLRSYVARETPLRYSPRTTRRLAEAFYVFVFGGIVAIVVTTALAGESVGYLVDVPVVVAFIVLNIKYAKAGGPALHAARVRGAPWTGGVLPAWPWGRGKQAYEDLPGGQLGAGW